MSLKITPSQQIYYDKDGTPLDAGFIYIGQVSQNPETNPVAVYWDSALTLPAPQPIRTLNGYPSRQGVIANIYTASSFSITVKSKRKELVFTSSFGNSSVSNYALLVFPDYAAASTAAATLPDGQVVDVAVSNTRYSVSGGLLTDERPSTPVSGPSGVVRSVQSKLRETVSVKDFGAVGDGVTDDTTAIQRAIDYASARSLELIFPAGYYKVIPNTSVVWEGGTCLAVFKMRTGMLLRAEGFAKIMIADGVSTDENPVHHQMFFTNEVLSNVAIRGFVLDMNGQNNKISPNRATKDYNRFMNAQVCVSGTILGVAARIDRCKITENIFQNNSGVSCIVANQSNSTGTQLSSYWGVEGNDFENVGLDTDDHSSIYGAFINSRIALNRFRNPSAYNSTAGTGGLCAIELHGSNLLCSMNTIENYFQALWVSTTFSELRTSKVVVSNNIARISGVFVDFWSQNLMPWGTNEGTIDNVEICGNTIEISDDPVDIQVRAFLKINARQQPHMVNFHDNVCRSYAQNTVLSLLLVRDQQSRKLDQISIHKNECSGLCTGFVAYFSGSGSTAVMANMERIRFEDNELGYLQTSTVGLPQTDVYLYGPSAGKIEEFRVGGLQHATAPITIDAAGRANVYGKAIVPITASWNGVTIGNGSSASRVAIDTESGCAHVTATLQAGTSTTASSTIYPVFSGIAADATGTVSASHIKSGAAVTLPAVVYQSASWVTLFGPSGEAFQPGSLSSSSIIAVDGKIPCRFATV